GNVTQLTDPLSNVMTYTYDSLKLHPLTSTNALTHVTMFEYDLMFGKVKKVTDPNGLVIEVVLDGVGRMKTQKQTDPNQSNTVVTMQTSDYLEASFPHTVLSKTFLDATTTVDGYTYLDGFGRTLQTRVEDSSGQYIVTGFVYDALGRMTEQTLPVFADGTAYNIAHN